MLQTVKFPAPLAVVPVDAAVELQHVPAAGGLVEPVDVLGDDGFQPALRLPLRQLFMGGVGLGLALVREIAVLHGGSVTVERSSENGTTFAVTLPLAQPC